MSADSSPSFNGFQADNLEMVRVPAAFFHQLLPFIDDLPQLRVLLYLFWHLEQQEGRVRFFKLKEMASDPALLSLTGGEKALQEALENLVKLQVILRAEFKWLQETVFFINSSQGRAAVEAIRRGEWRSLSEDSPSIHLGSENPNIFQLYEENIGTITPMMAEILKADEAAYPAAWIEEAVRIAVTRNVRNWKFVQAILVRWQKEGRGDEKNRRDDRKDSDSYRESWLGHD